jgi:hypothetical protein
MSQDETIIDQFVKAVMMSSFLCIVMKLKPPIAKSKIHAKDHFKHGNFWWTFGHHGPLRPIYKVYTMYIW